MLPVELAWLIAALGCGLGSAGLYQARLARRLARAHRELEAVRYEHPQGVPAQAFPALARCGVTRLVWRGEWLGMPLAGEVAAPQHGRGHWQGRIDGGEDIDLTLEASTAAARGERHWLASAACELLLLRWRAQAASDAARLEGALRQHALFALDTLHAARNLGQWAQFVADEFAAAADDAALLTAGRRLAEAAPLIRQRAQRLLAASRGEGAQEAAPPEDLAALIRACARMNGVALALTGQAHSRSPRGLWLTILDNLFLNARQHQAGARLTGRLAQTNEGARLELIFSFERFGVCADALFAPFRSGSDAGLGLGLYLARRAARQAQGELAAGEQPARFIVRLP